MMTWWSNRLEAAELMDSARRKAGLADFGDDQFRDPLHVLLASINFEARLTTLGTRIQRGRLIDALCNRLRATALLRDHPEIAQRDVGDVIVIAGPQRTGTTLLHRLLAADPEARALRSWEALNPVPFPKERAGHTRARRAFARRAQWGLELLAPRFFAIHPVEFEAPEEDVLLLEMSFMSQAPEAMMRVPTYAAWLEHQDHRPAYRLLHTLLQLLAWQQDGRHWVLKTPNHMEHLDTLFEVFPRAKIVQTERDPATATASFLSMVAQGRAIFSDRVDRREIGRHWLRKIARMRARASSARDRWGQHRFIDVAYADLIADPIAEVRRVYEFAGLELSDGAALAVSKARRRNPQYKYGRHHYRLEDFGLDREQVERAFAQPGGLTTRLSPAPVMSE